jgi:glutaredoxin 2
MAMAVWNASSAGAGLVGSRFSRILPRRRLSSASCQCCPVRSLRAKAPSRIATAESIRPFDSLGERILTGPQRSEIGAWADKIVAKTMPLTMPRYPLLGLPEFGTIAALDHYNLRKRKAFGDFVELRANTRHHIKELMPGLEELDCLIESPLGINGNLSLDDVRVLPLLRSAAVVKGLRLPRKVRDYFESMMSLIGYQPLPAV